MAILSRLSLGQVGGSSLGRLSHKGRQRIFYVFRVYSFFFFSFFAPEFRGPKMGIGSVVVGSAFGAPQIFAPNRSETLQNKGLGPLD